MAKVNIDSDVMDVLQNSTITSSSVKLPQQLSRDLYVRVNKVLTNCGGKWNRSAQAHLFDRDPRPDLGLALETGQTESLQQKWQAFFTPPELARYVALKASVEGKNVLEPSAGEGALADACVEAGARWVLCLDLNPQHVQTLLDKGHIANEADFLAFNADKGRKFDRIVMNPPFTKNQDVAHVKHALKFLKPGGRLVAIMAGNTNRPFFNEISESEATVEVEFLPEASFKESGTNVRTVLVTITTPEGSAS